MLFEYNQQPPFIQKYDLIKQFFIQIQQIKQFEEKPLATQKTEESVRVEDSTTQRQLPKQKKPVFLTKKLESKQEQKKSRESSQLRPSDIMMIEQQKQKIDQFCKDNQVLHNNNEQCMYLIKKMAKVIKNLQAQQCQDHINIIQQYDLQLRIKDAELTKKNECIKQIRDKYDEMLKLIEQHSIEEANEWNENQAYLAQLEIENLHLRRLLNSNFTEEQVKQMESQANDVELQFYENFCISRRDLERSAMEEYEKILAERKDKVGKQYIGFHLMHLQQQESQQALQPMHQPLEDLYAEEKEIMLKKSSQKTLSQEEKQKIMDDLLKPIGQQQKQTVNVQEVKQKQLDILNNSSNSKQQKLEIDIDPKETINMQDEKQLEKQDNKQVSQKQQILNSLNQGWQKLMSQQPTINKNNSRYQVYDDDDDQVTYDMKNHMFTNQQGVMYDDYMDDDEDEEEDSQIKQTQNRTLTKTEKINELQYQ